MSRVSPVEQEVGQDPLPTVDERQQLGVATLVCLVIANMVGAGVFTTSGFAIASVGDPARVMLGWWICGVWAVCGAIAYGGLVRRLKLSGGEYLFLSRLVHPAVGFLAGWISVVAGFTAPIAVTAYSAAAYALGDTPATHRWLTPLAVGIIVVATAFHLAGLHWGARAQNSVVFVKLGFIVVFLAWAYWLVPTDAWHGPSQWRAWDQWGPRGWADWSALLGAMSWIALSYTGFNAAIYVAGVARDSGREVARSMLGATLLVTALYLALNYMFVYGPPPEAIENKPEVAAIAANHLGGAPLAGIVRGTIVLAMLSSVFSLLMAGPQVYLRMAHDGVMPSILKAADGKPPRAATVLQAGLSIICVLIASLPTLINYLGLTLSACGALTVTSLWWVHRRLPGAEPIRRVETIALAIYLVITGLILLGSYHEHPIGFRAMIVTFVTGGAVYAGWLWNERRLERAN